MSDGGAWHSLGVDPAAATFPVLAQCDGLPVWVFRVGDGYRGVQEMCPHADRSLGTARLMSDGKMLRCTYHNYTFKLDSGLGVNCPGFAITVYEIREHEGALVARDLGRS